MAEQGLARIPRGRMVQASQMAKRTLERLEALRDVPTGSPAIARDTGLPSLRSASGDDLGRGIEWMRRFRMVDIGDELAGWIGTVDIEIGYDEDARRVTVEPPVLELERLRDEPRQRAKKLGPRAPIHELELLRTASI